MLIYPRISQNIPKYPAVTDARYPPEALSIVCRLRSWHRPSNGSACLRQLGLLLRLRGQRTHVLALARRAPVALHWVLARAVRVEATLDLQHLDPRRRPCLPVLCSVTVVGYTYPRISQNIPEYPGRRTLCFYVLGAFLPSLRGWCRHADPLIKTVPGESE